MKYLFWTAISFVVLSSTAIAEINFLPAGTDEKSVPSYIDTVRPGDTTINFSTNSTLIEENGQKRENLALTYGCPPKDSSGKRPFNYFFLEKKYVENGQTKTRTEPKLIEQGSSCEKLKKEDPSILNCKEQTVLSVGFREANPNQPRGPVRTAAFKFGINTPEKIEEFQKQLKECAGDNGIIAFNDPQGHGPVANMNLKTHCELPKQRLSVAGAAWDDNSFPQSHVRTTNAGVMVGDHTHIYFDERRNMFCIHFNPGYMNASTVCKAEFGDNGMTFPLDFLHGNKNVNHGVFRLRREPAKTGKPIIEVGTSTNPNGAQSQQRNKVDHKIDLSKPFIKATIDLNAAGKGITYESFKNSKEKPIRTLQMQPQYRLSTGLAAKTCDPAMCSLKAGDASPGSCQKKSPTINMATNASPLCYSCNGIGTGSCGQKTEFLNDVGQNNFKHMNSCSPGASVPPQEPPVTPPATNAEKPEEEGDPNEEY